MNLQSVGNGRTHVSIIQSGDKATQESTPKSTENKAYKTVNSGREFKQLEMKGVPFTVGDEQLVKAVERALKALEGPTTSFEMKYHEQTKAVIVKVFNKDTGELIREIPPEKTLDLVVKMMEFAGILIDEKV
jgi:flagellar protein FlaG